MSKQVSPFAALTGAERQIKWLEYQSIRLPYMQASIDRPIPQPVVQEPPAADDEETPQRQAPKQTVKQPERPQPPPEVPRVMPNYQPTRHSQYDAVIARMKQAELQSRRNQVSL